MPCITCRPTRPCSLTALLVVLLMSLLPIRVAAGTKPVLLSNSGSGRATGYAETNKIVTAQGKTHVAWLDSSDAGFEAKVRTLDHASGEWSPTYTLGPARDNHGGPALAIDSQGYLHAVYYPHSDPMRYRKSLRPHDASAWSEEVEFGQKLTYPTLLVAPDDTLLLTARRRGDRNEKWTLQFFRKPPDGDWSEPTTLIVPNETAYAHFQAAMAWDPDHQTIHLATRLYGDVPRWAYLVGAMRSTDFGETWERYDGTPIPLPANKDTLDAIEKPARPELEEHANSSDLRGGAIVVDQENVPHILYSKLESADARIRQAWIATPDEAGNWDKQLLNDKIDVLPDGWGLGMPGGITFTSDGHLALVLTTADDRRQQTMWGTSTSEVVWAISRDGGQSFSSRIISDPDPRTPHWLPNLERPTGFNPPVPHPAVLFLSGDRGKNNNAILSNQVYFWRNTPTPRAER